MTYSFKFTGGRLQPLILIEIKSVAVIHNFVLPYLVNEKNYSQKTNSKMHPNKR